MKENNEIMKKLWVGVVLMIAFVVCSQLRNEIATALVKLLPVAFASDVAYYLVDALDYVAFFLCLWLVLQAYKGANNILKMVGCVVGIAVIDFLLSELAVSVTGALVCGIVQPLFVVALLLLAFFWVTKKRPIFSKPLLIVGVCLFVAYVVLYVAEFFYLMSITNIMQFFTESVFSTLLTPCFYGLIFVTFWWMIDSEDVTTKS